MTDIVLKWRAWHWANFLKSKGYKIEDKTNLTTSLADDGKQYGIQYTKFVPILVKALQELSTKNDALETSLTSALARIKALEDE